MRQTQYNGHRTMTSIDDKQETAGLLFYAKYLHTDAIGSLINIDCAWRLSCLVVERTGRNRKKGAEKLF